MRQEYTLPELAAAVGMTERNIRAYRSRGLIPPPRLRGRVGYYGSDHLAQLRLVQALTGRGLSLGVVGQLMERGMAQHELSRLIRQELPGGPPVPVAPAVVEQLNLGDPDLLDALVEHGVSRRTARGVEADPALLSLANQLVAFGLPVLEVTRLCLAGGEAATSVHTRVLGTLAAPRRPALRPAEPLGTGADVPAADAPGDATGTTAVGSEPDGDAEAHPDAATTAVVLELTTTAFRLALETRLSRREP